MAGRPAEQVEAALLSHQLHAQELRTRAARLRGLAEAACDRAVQATEAVSRRRGRPLHDQSAIDQERARSTRELEAYVTGLRREQETLRAEADLQQAWFREQVLAMVNQGWSREELAEIGFRPEFLADLGLADHPGLPLPPP